MGYLKQIPAAIGDREGTGQRVAWSAEHAIRETEVNAGAFRVEFALSGACSGPSNYF